MLSEDYEQEQRDLVQKIEIAYDLIGIVPMELLNAVITGKAA